MCTVIEERKVKAARKEHYCNASEFLTEGSYREMKLTFSEWRSVAIAKAKGWKVLKGEPYVRQRNTYSGDIWVYKAIPAIHEICIKQGVFDDIY
jgi:hypothetical protein